MEQYGPPGAPSKTPGALGEHLDAVGFGVSDVQEPGRNDGVLDMLSAFRAYRLVVDADAAAGDAVDE